MHSIFIVLRISAKPDQHQAVRHSTPHVSHLCHGRRVVHEERGCQETEVPGGQTWAESWPHDSCRETQDAQSCYMYNHVTCTSMTHVHDVHIHHAGRSSSVCQGSS